jgi:hypothetical protein
MMLSKEQVLLDLIKGKGFIQASISLNCSDVHNLDEAIKMWRWFPKNMDKYPAVLKNRRDYSRGT